MIQSRTSRLLPTLLLVVALMSCGAVCAAADDILIADFEGKDYGEWKAEGQAFGTGPARGTLPKQKPVTGFEGKGLVNSYLGTDQSQGTLTSPEFKIQRKYINFLIGGGSQPNLACMNLLADGKVVRTATGQSTTSEDTEELTWATWDVSDLAGKSVRLQIVDRVSGGWGHVNVDQIVQSDTKKAEPVVPEPPAALYDEKYRPQFHFSPKDNWTNDPNGCVWYAGEWHLFFQHNPSGINWGNMTWGHAVSPDLFHWEELADAIERDKLGTIFSGSAVVDHNNTAGFQKGDEKAIVAIYTAAGGTSPESKGQPFTQCIAYSTDRGRTFTKYDKNPVLKHMVGGNRDPKVVWHEPAKKWIMALFLDGSRFAFFASPNLKEWTKLHEINVPGCGECPDFFKMWVDGDKAKEKWVWTAANGRYLVGDFDGQTFKPDHKDAIQADWGGHYYAVQSYDNVPDARRIQIAWMNGGKYPGMPFNQQMNVPCEMTLRSTPAGLRIFRMPAAEIEKLRTQEHKLADLALEPGANPLKDLQGDLLDIRAEIELGQAQEVGFKLRGQEIVYKVKARQLTCLGRSAPMEAKDGRIRLAILLDRTSIEVFGNDGLVPMTMCFLPKGDKSVEAFARGGAAKIVSLNVYELRSAWKKP